LSKPRRIINPGRSERPETWCYTCCLPGCRRMVALSDDSGSPLALCKPHAEQLPDKLFFDMEEAAGGCVFDPAQIETALELRVQVKKFFGQAPRKKAKRTHA
jgi:hypothetical protein